MKRLTLSISCLCALTLSAFAQETTNTASTPAPADNTARNERDRSGKTKTSGDQSNTSEDTKMTAAIRRAVVGDSSLSMTAKNVKIITANGVVTLRGPVKNAQEKATIEILAKSNAGNATIENQLEVKEAK